MAKTGVFVAITSYYVIISLIFIFGQQFMVGIEEDVGANATARLNQSGVDESAISRADLWGVATGFSVSFSRYLLFTSFGFGIGQQPLWIQVPFSFFIISMNLLTAFFVLTAVWDG